MKKIVGSVLLICCISLLPVYSQVSFLRETDRNGTYFDRGKEMFELGNYVGCADQLNEYKKEAVNASLIERANYMLAISAYECNKPDAVMQLQSFLNNYPWSVEIPSVNFCIGNSYFFNGDFKRAVRTYEAINMETLSRNNQADYCYRLGLSYIKTDRIDEAAPLFNALSTIGEKYKNESLFYTAYIQYVNKEYARALAGFQEVEHVRGFEESSAYYITQIYFVNGQYDRVISVGTKLLSEYPGNQFNTEVCRLLGESYYYRSDDTRAEEYLLRYVDESGSPARTSLYMLGVAQFRLQQYRAAVASLSRTTSVNDALMQSAYLYLGQCYLKLDDQKNAKLAFEMASSLDFDRQVQETAMFNYALSIHESSFSPFDESVITFENFLNKFPDSRYADQINDYLVEVYLTTRNYRAALASIDKIKHPSSKIMQAKERLFFQLGTEYFVNADLVRAKKMFSDAIALGNYDKEVKALAYFWRGECNYRQDDFSQAGTDYRAYLSTTGQTKKEIYKLAQYNLAYTCFKQQKFSDALQYFQQYVSGGILPSANTVADAYNRIGDCYFYARNFPLAEANYTKAAEISPASADYALYQRGFVAGLQKDYTLKISDMDKLISGYPRSEYVDDALFEKGLAYVIVEKPDQAVQSFKQMIADFPHSAITRKAGIQLGMLFFNQNDLDKSINAYKQVIADYPGSEEAKVAAEDLKSVYLEKNDIASYASYINSLGGVVRFAAEEQDSLTYLAAEKLYMRGDKSKAEKSLLNYLQSFPKGAFNSNASYYLGMLYFNEKNYPASLTAFESVLQLPDGKFGEDALARVAEIHYINKEYQKALNSFKTLALTASELENQQAARLGILRMSEQLKLDNEVVLAANKLLEDPKLSPELSGEARFARSRALINLKQPEKAVDDWKLLAKDTRSQYGAHSSYLLAQYYFDNKRPGDAELVINTLIEKGTSHQYWLARSFVLLSDIAVQKNDKFQAKQYLLSLKNNYKAKDDISGMIETRLQQIGE